MSAPSASVSAGVQAGRHASALVARPIYLPEVVEVRSSGPRRMDRCAARGRPELVLLVVSHTRQDDRRVRRLVYVVACTVGGLILALVPGEPLIAAPLSLG